MGLKYKIFFFLFFTALICTAQGSTLTAVFENSKCKDKVLVLYKYNSPFSKELIEKQKSANSLFRFQRKNMEVDTYLLMDGDSETALLFIWDNDIVIDLNCENIDRSIVNNSPLTSELNKTNKLKYDLYILPVIKLDSLISQCQNSNLIDKENSCQALINERARLETESRKLYDEFIISYIENHPNSFVSLYYLTFGGDGFLPEKKYIKAFKFLSEKLKNHSRSRMYTN